MDLRNKKINFLGDSITEGVGVSCPECCFVFLMKQKYGLAEARNYGIGGTSITPQETRSQNPQWDKDFCGRFYDMDADADAIVVFGGTNDFGHGPIPIGQIGDSEPTNFCGAYYYLISGIQEKFPKAKILCVTPLHRDNEDQPRNDKNKDFPAVILAEYVEAIRQVAKLLKVPVLDLFDFTSTPDAAKMDRKFFPDGLHPDDRGHEVLAELIGNALKEI